MDMSLGMGLNVEVVVVSGTPSISLINPILTVDEASYFTTVDGNFYFTTFTS